MKTLAILFVLSIFVLNNFSGSNACAGGAGGSGGGDDSNTTTEPKGPEKQPEDKDSDGDRYHNYSFICIVKMYNSCIIF